MILTTAALDSVVRISAPEPVVAALRGLLPAASARSPTHVVNVAATARGYAISDASTLHVSTLAEAVIVVLTVVNRVVLEQCQSLAMHAGAVAVGSAVAAFPGESGAGKSTLVAACLQAGCGYVSDEALVCELDGRVRPYPKPLTLLDWSLDRLGLPPAATGERPVTVAELGGTETSGPLALSHVLLLERGLGRPRMAPVSRALAASTLLTHAFNHYRQPAASMTTVADLVRQAQCWRLRYDEPEAAAEVVRGLLLRDGVPD